MALSWISRNRNLEVSPKARLVDDREAEALLRKLEAIDWKPQNGFLKDQPLAREELEAFRDSRAA